MAAIVFKLVLAVVAGLLGAWVLRTRLMALPERTFLGAAVALQLVGYMIIKKIVTLEV